MNEFLRQLFTMMLNLGVSIDEENMKNFFNLYKKMEKIYKKYLPFLKKIKSFG